jgi:cytochrome b
MTTLDNNIQAPVRRDTQDGEHRLVWDWPVRLFHWSLVASFLGAFVTNKLGVAYFKYHVWCGYAVIALVSFRILWGLLGTKHARFWNFVRGPRATWRYARDFWRGYAAHHAGHNPLGALMVLLLLGALGAQAAFGLFSNDEIFNVGPLAGYVSKQTSLLLTSLHRRTFYWIAAAVVIHVGAVILHVVGKRENLVRAMITGRKGAHAVAPHDEIDSSRGWLAVALAAGVVTALALVVHFAPGAEADLSEF